MAHPAHKCQYYLEKKRRWCKFDAIPGKSYCGNHAFLFEKEAEERVPCPADPKQWVVYLGCSFPEAAASAAWGRLNHVPVPSTHGAAALPPAPISPQHCCSRRARGAPQEMPQRAAGCAGEGCGVSEGRLH